MLTASIFKKYPGITVDVDFVFNNGILVLFGPSGSGKTTILNGISGLLKPDRGYISLGEKTFFCSSERVNIPARKRRIGYVFQDYSLFPHMSVRKNVLYGIPAGLRRADGSRLNVRDVLEMLRISHLQDRYPASLSGGEKQRVALARTLMVEPDLLLLDEPLSALDFKTRQQLRGELRQLQQTWNIPFVLVTHSREEMKALADDVLYLDRGSRTGSLHLPTTVLAFDKAM